MKINQNSYQKSIATDYYQTAYEKNKKQDNKVDDSKQDKDIIEISQEAKEALSKSEKNTDTKSTQVDRQALIKVLKDEQEARKADLLKMFRESILNQATDSWMATHDVNNEDDIWKFIASGNYTVSEAAKADAQKAISEDGYYGVKQTSQRIFDFAMALSNGDADKMKEMQTAIEKGFAEATGAWGKELPSICQDTHEAINKKFEDFYKEN